MRVSERETAPKTTRGDRPMMRGAPWGLLAAVLWGASAPASKLLVGRVGPLTMASLLYLGAAAVLVPERLRRSASREARLRRSDVSTMLGVIVAGGVVGPVLLMIGLKRLSGVASSLLLNLEAPLTIVIAVVAFGEHLGKKQLVAAAMIVVAAAALGLRPGEVSADVIGALAVSGATLAWAIDNNLTQKLSLRDPAAVVRVKSFGAGVCSLAIARAVGEPWPTLRDACTAMVVGALGYGLSLLFHMRALRLLGAARQATIFATAPFVGALVAVPLLHEHPTWLDAAAFVVMAIGVGWMIGERHEHTHTHEAMEHDHLHTHDEHHRHDHDPARGPVIEPHAHPHRHEPLEHAHPHVSDLHHRHRHD
jgi:drug/metabolite transporter (DMT)-like permease